MKEHWTTEEDTKYNYQSKHNKNLRCVLTDSYILYLVYRTQRGCRT